MKLLHNKFLGFVLTVFCVLGFTGAAQALPFTADIDAISVLHDGSNPGGAGDPNDWLRFDDDATIDLAMAGMFMVLDGVQSFNMSSNNGATATLNILTMTMNLDDDSDGFNAGSLMYMIDGIMGVMLFDNYNYGDSGFNSSSWIAPDFNLMVWGGDPILNRGMDFSITAQIFEPGILSLLGIGLFGIGLTRRRT